MSNFGQLTIRPLSTEDAAFVTQVAPRLYPGPTASPRDPARMQSYFATFTPANLTRDAGAEAFVALGGGVPLGLLVIKPDFDYFTDHPRAYIEILVVAESAEGRGVGRALMAFAEQWGRERGCREVVLDVFANNTGAIAFYERVGYAPDHLRMSKPLA
ncbi:MAG: N-acetyltransferase [Thermomicrobiales bacterium]|nr:N-acetyltransferase [Thermomicrobiales bacterium]